MAIKRFKKPSQIIFKEAKEVDDSVIRLNQIDRGVTFMHQETVFMRVDVSGYQATKKLPIGTDVVLTSVLSSSLWVINLQTGRVFILPGETEIDLIKVTMTVAGE